MSGHSGRHSGGVPSYSSFMYGYGYGGGNPFESQRLKETENSSYNMHMQQMQQMSQMYQQMQQMQQMQIWIQSGTAMSAANLIHQVLEEEHILTRQRWKLITNPQKEGPVRQRS